EHQDWISILLGTRWEDLTQTVRDRLEHLGGKGFAQSWLNHDPLELHHVAGAILVTVVTLFLAVRALQRRRQAEASLIPDRGLTARNFFEILCEVVFGQMEKQMGKARARRYFPIIASFACFILFSNLLGLVPGFSPPTDNYNTTVPLAITSFLAYHIYGVA